MICTFYSFKGGVGRSMALANVAELFYQKGLKVLMVDFDLEAPGLDRYFDTENAICNAGELLNKPGIVDLITSYKKSYSLSFQDTLNNERFKGREKIDKIYYYAGPLSNFVSPIYKENDLGGSLSIIGAGMRSNGKFEEYSKYVRYFDWKEFYDNWDGELFFEWFRRETEAISDIVLIDSRTGITEMGGVCTHHLADLAIIFVAPNQQNLDGVSFVAKSLQNPELMKGIRKNRPILQIFVPSRIEHGERNLLDDFANQFDEKLVVYISKRIKFEKNAFLDLKIPYVTYYSYNENVAVRDTEKASASDLIDAFKRLAFSIAQLAPIDSRIFNLYSDEKRERPMESDLHKLNYHVRALIEKEQGNYERARELFIMATQIDPKNAFVYLAWAVMEKELFNINRARELFQMAEQIDPKIATMHQAWAIMEKEQRNYERARVLFQMAIETDPKNATTYQAWAVTEREQGNYEMARELFQMSAQIDPKNATTYLAWAMLEKEQDNDDRARDLFQMAIEIDPKNVFVYQPWAMMEKELGNYERARELFQMAIETDPRNAITYQYWAMMEKELGNYERVRELFQMAIETDPKNAITYQSWAMMEKELRSYERARKLFQMATEADPGNAVVHQAWAMMEKELGNYKRARELFQMAIETDPKNAITYQSWAMMEAQLNRLENAQEIVEKGLQHVQTRRRDMSLLLSTKGSLLASQKAFGQARRYFIEALSLDDKNPLTHYNFAVDCLQPDGDKKDACKHLYLALQLSEQKGRDRRRIRRALKENCDSSEPENVTQLR